MDLEKVTKKLQKLNSVLWGILPTAFAIFIFSTLYLFEVEYWPPKVMSAFFSTCTSIVDNSLKLFISSPFSYYEVLLEHFWVGTSISTALYYNFILPAIIIFACGIYLKFFSKVLNRQFSLFPVFILSVLASYLTSGFEWVFGPLLFGTVNCPGTGTSIIGVSLSGFLCFGIFLDMFSQSKNLVNSYLTYILPFSAFLFIVLSYFASGTQHIYGLLFFEFLAFLYLRLRKH